MHVSPAAKASLQYHSKYSELEMCYISSLNDDAINVEVSIVLMFRLGYRFKSLVLVLIIRSGDCYVPRV